MSDMLERLPEGWDELVRADDEALGPPWGAKKRVRRRVEGTLGIAAFAVGTAAGLGSTATAATATSATSAALVKVTVGVIAISAASGTAYLGLREHSEWLNRTKPSAAVRPSVPVPPAPPTLGSPPPSTLSLPTAPDPLAAEEQLLSEARRALARGALDEASRKLELYRDRFGEGRLSEEHEALEIRVLVRGGHMAEARRRASVFRAAHPRSLQLNVIDEALRGTP